MKLFIVLALLQSVVFSQKMFIVTEGYVTPIEFRDNSNMPPPSYSGVYEYGQPVEDEYGNYTGGDGYLDRTEFLIGASNQRITETLEIEGHEKPVITNFDKFDFTDNKITTESFVGYFQYFKYKTKDGKTKEVECFVINANNSDNVYVKVE